MTLPALHASWLSTVLEALPGPEPRSGCAACPMVGSPSEDTVFAFPADARCCTTIPAIPNVLVGAALRTGSAPGLESLRARIADPRACTPLGVEPPPGLPAAFRDPLTGYARARAPRCPHQQADLSCGVHDTRPAACATWFCRPVDGLGGHRFWRAAFAFLHLLEETAARAVALRLLEPAAAEALFPVPGVRPAERPDVWGRWASDKEGYFRACADEADRLGADALLAAAGPIGAHRAAQLRAAAAERKVPTPSRITTGEVRRRTIGGADVVFAYSPHDGLALPPALVDAISTVCDGRPTAEAQAALVAAGHPVDDGLLAALVERGVLVEAGAR